MCGGTDRWAGNESRQYGAFGDRQLRRRLSEVTARGGLDAVGAVAEVDPIEIRLEDLFLPEPALDAECQERFLQFPLKVPVRRQGNLSDELLGDGAPVLLDRLGLHVYPCRPGEADDVHARVFIEVAVLGRQNGGNHRV